MKNKIHGCARHLVLACAFALVGSALAAYENCWKLNTTDAVVDFSEPSNWKYDDASQTVLTAFPIPSGYLRLYGSNKTFYLSENVSVDNMHFNSINSGTVTFDLNNEANGGTAARTLSSKFASTGNATFRQSSGGKVLVTSGTLNCLDDFQLDGAGCALVVSGKTAHVTGYVCAGHSTDGTRFEVIDGATYVGKLKIGRVNNKSYNTLVRAANGGKITLTDVLTYSSPNPGNVWSNQVMLAENGGVIDFANRDISFAKSNKGAYLCLTNNLWLANGGVLTNLASFAFWQGARNVLAATNSSVYLRGAVTSSNTYPASSNRVDFIGSTVSAPGFSAASDAAAWGNTVTIAGGTKMVLNGNLVFCGGHDNAFVIDGAETVVRSAPDRKELGASGRKNLVVVSGGAVVTNFYGFSFNGTSNTVRVCGTNTKLRGEGTFALCNDATARDNTMEILDGATFSYPRWRTANGGGWGAHFVISNATAVAETECSIPNTLASSNCTVRLCGDAPLLKATNGPVTFRSNTAVTFDIPVTGYNKVPIVAEASGKKVEFETGTSIHIVGLRQFLKVNDGEQTVVLAKSEDGEVKVDAVTLAAANAALAADGAEKGYKAKLFLSVDGASETASGTKRYLVLRGKRKVGLMLVVY